MGLRCFLILFLQIQIIFSHAFAETTVIGGNDKRVRDTAKGAFTPYLGCLNRLISERLNLSIGSSPEPENKSAIFSMDNKIYLVEPHKVTADQVPLYRPPSGIRPFYPLAYQAPDESKTSSINYYVDTKTGKGDVASVNRVDPSALLPTPYFHIGKDSSRLSNTEALRAIQNETVPYIESFSSYLEDVRKEPMRDHPRFYEERVEAAKEALCACAETNHPEIVRAANKEAEELKAAGITVDITGCSSAMVSKNDDLKNLIQKLILPSASAKPKAKSAKPSQITFQFAESLRGIASVNTDFKICTRRHSYVINSKSGLLSDRNKSCAPRETLSKTLSVKKTKGHVPNPHTFLITKE